MLCREQEFTIKVRAIFDGFDLDGTGVLTSQELRKVKDLPTPAVVLVSSELLDTHDGLCRRLRPWGLT